MARVKLEEEIISLYVRDITSYYSINQIAGKLKRTYPNINRKVTQLIKRQIFKRTIIGRSHLCTLNLSSDEARNHLVMQEIKKSQQETRKKLELASIQSAIKSISGQDILLALATHDQVIIVAHEQSDKDKLKARLPHKVSVMTSQEFVSALLETPNIYQNHTILQGYEKYYEIVRDNEQQLKMRYSLMLQ